MGGGRTYQGDPSSREPSCDEVGRATMEKVSGGLITEASVGTARIHGVDRPVRIARNYWSIGNH
jgi:hypothetical protein